MGTIMMSINMRMGDLVEPKDIINSPLKKFGHTYINAVVYNIVPFILINQNATYLFEDLDHNDFKIIGVAHWDSLIHIIYWQQRQINDLKG